ncbi:hypothetical protein [Nocardia sp. IFM 10818]
MAAVPLIIDTLARIRLRGNRNPALLPRLDGVLPTQYQLLRAVRGHSIDGYTPPARIVAARAHHLAELNAAAHVTDCRSPQASMIENSRRATIAEIADTIRRSVTDETVDCARLSTIIAAVAARSEEAFRALRCYGATDHRVHKLWFELAELSDEYAGMIIELSARERRTPAVRS